VNIQQNRNKNLKNFFGAKVLITGTTGFKGSWLALWLKKLGAKVYGVGLKPDNSSVLFKNLSLSKKINQEYLDITNFEKINSCIKKIKPDIIFHLAAQSIVSEGFQNPLKTFNTNIMGSVNILEAVRKNKVSNLVYVTSDKCYLNTANNRPFIESDKLGGDDNYSASKASAEIIFNSFYKSYFQSKTLKHASVRAGNVIGGGDFKEDRIVPDIIRSIYLKKKLIIRNPSYVRPWQHVLDPLSGYLILGEKLLNNKLKGTIYPSWNFGPRNANCKNVLILANNILKLCDERKKVNFQKFTNFKESNFLSISSKKANKEIRWKPTLNFDQSVRFTIDWYKNFFKKNKNIDNYNFSLNQIEKFENFKLKS
tara:strand:+ start:55 stop:1155 length:1101 start_codon:yes stop_codon:yes gene_type:complete